MSEFRETSSPPGPKRLSWGRSSSQRQPSSRPATSNFPSVAQQQQYADRTGLVAETPCRDQEPHQPFQQQHSQVCCNPAAEQQSCKAILRGVLSTVLGEGPQLDHFQVTLPAVLAVLQHKLSEAASISRSRATAAAAVTAKQQLAALQKEAEAKAAKQLQDAADQAAAASAQHSREVSSLQAQLCTLQRQHKQLQGKSAQQARDLREAAESAKAARCQQQVLQGELQELRKQLQGKAAALSRSTSVRQQEAAALKAELQQTTAAAEAIAAQHQQDIQQLQEQHSAEVAQLEAQHKLHLQQQLQEAAAEHHHQQLQLTANWQAQLWHELNAVHEALQDLQSHQQEAAACAMSTQSACMQETSVLTDFWQQQLQEVRAELAAVKADAQEVVQLVADQQAALQALQQHQARLAPEGLQALAQQAHEAAAARADHAAALQQLQNTCMQLATVQPTVQQLQQRQQAWEQERADLQAELAQAATAASCQKQELQQQVTELQQQLEQAQTHSSRLQKQLEAVQLELSAAREEASTAASRAEAAEQLVHKNRGQYEAHCRSLEDSYCCGFQQLHEHLQWLCSSYFVADSSPPSASSAVCATQAMSAQPSAVPAGNKATSPPAPAAEASTGFSGLQLRADGIAEANNSKLQQLSQHLAGDGERLLQLFEQYKTHKQEMSRAAGDACSGAPAATASTTTSSTCTAAAPVLEPVLQLQQQVLQLEACLLKFMLSLQEALDEAKQQQQRSAGTGMLLSAHLNTHNSSAQCGAGSQSVSPNRPERPSTAMSFSSSMTGVSSSRSSSLGSQLLAAMRREKQQLALELKKLHGIQRTPLTVAVAASGASFPWQRGAGSNQSTPRGMHSGAATGRQWCAQAEASVHALGGGVSHVGVDTAAGTCPGASAAQQAALGLVGGQHGCWEEVDEVLQLLQGCQLGLSSGTTQQQPSQAAHAQQADEKAHPETSAGPSSCSPAVSSPVKRGANRQGIKLQWRSSSMNSSRTTVGAAAGTAGTASARSPARTVSWGHTQTQVMVSPKGAPVLKKGIGSLMARR